MYNRYYPYQYYRSEKPPQPPAPIILKPPHPPAHPKPPQKPPKRKLNFKCLKNDTCKSLNDVECFLNDFSHTWKYIRLIKLLK